MQWRGWSTYSDMVAIWNWLDTEQTMFNFVTETTKVFVRYYLTRHLNWVVHRLFYKGLLCT